MDALKILDKWNCAWAFILCTSYCAFVDEQKRVAVVQTRQPGCSQRQFIETGLSWPPQAFNSHKQDDKLRLYAVASSAFVLLTVWRCKKRRQISLTSSMSSVCASTDRDVQRLLHPSFHHHTNLHVCLTPHIHTNKHRAHRAPQHLCHDKLERSFDALVLVGSYVKSKRNASTFAHDDGSNHSRTTC